MTSIFLVCALALPAQFQIQHPPLHHGDVTIFSSIVNMATKHNGYRMLIVGHTQGWIESLRTAEVAAFGIWNSQTAMAYQPFYVIGDYGQMPFRSARFKLIAVTAFAEKNMLFEIDRLLVPEGFMAISAGEVLRVRGFLIYFRYVYIGQTHNGMSLWQKHDRESGNNVIQTNSLIWHGPPRRKLPRVQKEAA